MTDTVEPPRKRSRKKIDLLRAHASTLEPAAADAEADELEAELKRKKHMRDTTAVEDTSARTLSWLPQVAKVQASGGPAAAAIKPISLTSLRPRTVKAPLAAPKKAVEPIVETERSEAQSDEEDTGVGIGSNAPSTQTTTVAQSSAPQAAVTLTGSLGGLGDLFAAYDDVEDEDTTTAAEQVTSQQLVAITLPTTHGAGLSSGSLSASDEAMAKLLGAVAPTQPQLPAQTQQQQQPQPQQQQPQQPQQSQQQQYYDQASAQGEYVNEGQSAESFMDADELRRFRRQGAGLGEDMPSFGGPTIKTITQADLLGNTYVDERMKRQMQSRTEKARLQAATPAPKGAVRSKNQVAYLQWQAGIAEVDMLERLEGVGAQHKATTKQRYGW